MCCPYLNTLVSGSPIIQDGKLVGAVTHVMAADPSSGDALGVGRINPTHFVGHLFIITYHEPIKAAIAGSAF